MNSSVPRLDFTPKRKKPLSMLNPTDYLILFYWVFFFPQALFRYEEKFSVTTETNEQEWSQKLRAFIRDPTPQRNLFFQGQLLNTMLLLVFFSLMYLLKRIGVDIDMRDVVGGVTTGITIGIAVGIAGGAAGGAASGIAFGVAGGVAFGTVFGVALGITGGIVFDIAEGITKSVAIGIACSAAIGIAVGLAVNVAVGVVSGVASGVAGGIAITIAIGIAGSIVGGIAGGIASGVFFGATDGGVIGIAIGIVVGGVAFSIGVIISTIRITDYFISLLLFPFHQGNRDVKNHLTTLPLPRLQHKLVFWLKQNPRQGAINIRQIAAYNQQIIPVSRAVNMWLASLLPFQLLPAVTLFIPNKRTRTLSERRLWEILKYGSVSLKDEILDTGFNSFFLIPQRFRQQIRARFIVTPRLDTPVRAACAGFWLLHLKEIEQAHIAFAKVRHLPHGETLYQSAFALHSGLNANNLAAISTFAVNTDWLTMVEKQPLRPQVIVSLNRLHNTAQEANVAKASLSKLNQTAALNRAIANLTTLIADAEKTCPYPEWPIIKKIAQSWQGVLVEVAGKMGQIISHKPIHNPFIVGNPVSGKLFTGRQEILERLESLWGSELKPETPSIVLFGHRRMGKTSILQNLAEYQFGFATTTVYFTMQQIGKPRHTGELLYAIALELYDVLLETLLTDPVHNLTEPTLVAYEQSAYTTFNRFLRTIKKAIGSERRLILAIDEFELIEYGINGGWLEAELLGYLRGIIHREPWLILVLAGLHTLEEMTADYWNPLFASVTPVRVSFLDEKAAAQLLANPIADFPLDVTHETAARVYHWVHGQPYLTQLIGHTLVRRYNRAILKQGELPEPRFTSTDVDEVVMAADFYEQGSYYFTGVWGQAERGVVRGQIEILEVLAKANRPLLIHDVIVMARLTIENGMAALTVLTQHDVVKNTNGTVDFTVPLMRRWIREIR